MTEKKGLKQKLIDCRFSNWLLLLIFSQFNLVLFSVSNVYPLSSAPLKRPSSENWYSVTSGNSLITPVLTSYGFATLLEGRNLISCTYNGGVRWQVKLNGQPAPFLTTTPSDFIYTVTSSGGKFSILSFYNPSGVLLWSIDTEIEIKSKPIIGCDGRVFIYSENVISCYGLDGFCRWKKDFSSIQTIHTLNDGSLFVISSDVVYNSEHTSSMNISFRISPYGESLEKIILSGKVKSAATTEAGVIIAFEDNTAGCLLVKNNTALSVWKMDLNAFEENFFFNDIQASANGSFIVFSSDRKALFFTTENIDFDTGSVMDGHTTPLFIHSFSTDNNDTSIVSASFTDNMFSLFCISNSTNELSAYIWQTTDLKKSKNDLKTTGDNDDYFTSQYSILFPTSSSFFYPLFIPKNGSVLLCCDDWCLYGFEVFKPNGGTVGNVYLQNETEVARRISLNNGISIISSSYFSDSNQNAGISFSRLLQIEKLLKQTLYGVSEKEFNGEIISCLNEIQKKLMQSSSNFRGEPSFYTMDITRTEKIIQITAQTGTSSFISSISSLIDNETDSTVIAFLFQAAGQIGYDPDGLLINSIQRKIESQPSLASNKLSAEILCDAVYKICRFMGRPAFYSTGKNILSNLLSAQFEQNVREYAISTLNRILLLQM